MAVSQFVVDQLRRVGYLFYVAPSEDLFIENLKDKKSFSVEVVPAFVFLIVLEQLSNWWQNKLWIRFSPNDTVTSLAQGMIMEIGGILNGGIGILCYVWVYENWRVTELPWDSWITWLIVFLAVDFGYYWAHRAAHEVNILWAGHQVHHSSEYYNLSTALRQSVLQDHTMFFIYLPLALVIPPQVYAIHKELNMLFQFWIHTQAIKKVGPLEYIFNTPSHHRVHHGVNRYCIDKNYAGVLIIWDRMFGTFVTEGEAVAYGLTQPIKTFDPFKIQFNYLGYLIRGFRHQKTWADSLSVLFKGPGWLPGKPRLGSIEDVPDVHAPIRVWSPETPSWLQFYGMLHYMLLVLDYLAIANAKSMNGTFVDLAVQAVYVILSLTILAALFEGQEQAKKIEVLRIVIYILLTQTFSMFSFETRFQAAGHVIEISVLSLHMLSSLFLLHQTLLGSPLNAKRNQSH